MENLETPNNDQLNQSNPFDTVPTVSLGKNALTYGAILGGINVVYSLILWIMGQTTNKYLGYVGLIFVIGLMYYGTKEYRDKQLGGFMTYGKAFTSNFLIAAIFLSVAFARSDLAALPMFNASSRLLTSFCQLVNISLMMDSIPRR